MGISGSGEIPIATFALRCVTTMLQCSPSVLGHSRWHAPALASRNHTNVCAVDHIKKTAKEIKHMIHNQQNCNKSVWSLLFGDDHPYMLAKQTNHYHTMFSSSQQNDASDVFARRLASNLNSLFKDLQQAVTDLLHHGEKKTTRWDLNIVCWTWCDDDMLSSKRCRCRYHWDFVSM